MSNDGNVSFTPIPFPFSPFPKETPLFYNDRSSLFGLSSQLVPTGVPLFYNMFFFLFLFYILPLFIFIFSHGGLLVLYFFPLLPFLCFFFRGASEVAGIRFFFLYIIGISISPPLLLLPSATAAAEARDPGFSQMDRKGKKVSHDRQKRCVFYFYFYDLGSLVWYGEGVYCTVR